MRLLSRNVEQKIIIKVLSLFIILVSVLFELHSLNPMMSIVYCLMGVLLGVVGFIKADKIKLFSPIYIMSMSIFFSFVFSGLYYFTSNIDVMGNPLVINNSVLFEINCVYSLFFTFLILPVLVYMFNSKKYISIKFFNKSFCLANINLKLMIINIFFIIWIFITLGYTHMSLLTALKDPLSFRLLITNGSFSMANTIFLLIITSTYIIYLKDIFLGRNHIKIYNKIILACILLLWSIICGSRSFLIFAVMMNFMIFYTFFKKIKIRDILVTLLGIGFCILFSSFFLFYRMSKGYFDVNMFQQSRLDVINDYVARNDAFANSIQFFMYIERTNGTILYFNDTNFKEEIINHTIKFLPKTIRDVFKSDKVDLFNTKMTKLIYPGTIEKGCSYSFGIIPNIFWNFGLWGIIVVSLISGIIIVFLETIFNTYRNNDIFLFLYPLIINLIQAISVSGIINYPFTMSLIYCLPTMVLFIQFFLYKNVVRLK